MPTLLFQHHPYRPTDLHAIYDLISLCDSQDQLEENQSLRDLELEFASPDLDPQRDLQVWETSEGQVIGWSQLWPETGEDRLDAYYYWRIHPEYRHDPQLPAALFNWAEGRLREVMVEKNLARGRIMVGERSYYDFNNAAARQQGYSPVRYFFRMKFDLQNTPLAEPVWPAGYTLSHVQGEADITRWVEAFNLSFIDHYNFHEKSLANAQHWRKNEEYRPDLDLIAIAPDGETVAGFCYCTIAASENERLGRKEGWVADLGTRRGHRQIGLGRALLLAGLQALKTAGMESVLLGVDAENPSGALGLYERVGFRKAYTNVMSAKDFTA